MGFSWDSSGVRVCRYGLCGVFCSSSWLWLVVECRWVWLGRVVSSGRLKWVVICVGLMLLVLLKWLIISCRCLLCVLMCLSWVRV